MLHTHNRGSRNLPRHDLLTTDRASRARTHSAKRATAESLRRALSHVTAEWLADATGVSISRVRCWLDPDDADVRPAPVWWLMRLPAEERSRALAELASQVAT